MRHRSGSSTRPRPTTTRPARRGAPLPRARAARRAPSPPPPRAARGARHEAGARREVRRVRRDPFADAGLLADGASRAAAHRRRGRGAPRLRRARRARPAKIRGRAPSSAIACATRAGSTTPTRAYAVLEQLVPDDPAAHPPPGARPRRRGPARHRRAHARARRADRRPRRRRAASASSPAASRSDAARRGAGAPRRSAPPGRRAAGARRGRAAAPARRDVILVRAPAGADADEARRSCAAPRTPAKSARPRSSAEGIGLYTLRSTGRRDGDACCSSSAPPSSRPRAATKVRVDALRPGRRRRSRRGWSRPTSSCRSPGKAVEVGWNGPGGLGRSAALWPGGPARAGGAPPKTRSCLRLRALHELRHLGPSPPACSAPPAKGSRPERGPGARRGTGARASRSPEASWMRRSPAPSGMG